MSFAFVVVKLPLVAVVADVLVELTLESSGELVAIPLISNTTSPFLYAPPVKFHVEVTLVTAAEFGLENIAHRCEAFCEQ